MKQAGKATVALCLIALLGVVLLACSNNSGKADKETASTTRKYTDYKGHEVDIPVSPKRIIFSGETFSDLLALNVTAVGTAKDTMKGTIYEDQLKNVEDVGFPTNLEKAQILNRT